MEKEEIIDVLEKEADKAEQKANETNDMYDIGFWRGIWKAISTVEKGEIVMTNKSKRFRELCDEALQKADELFKESKNNDYNQGGVEITDYFDCLGNMVEGTFYPVYKKVLRLRSLIASGNKEANEPKLDSCIDLINYARFLYAAIKMEDNV